MNSLETSARIEEFASECIFVNRRHPNAIIAKIVQEFPAATGLDVVFALVSIAEAVRAWLPKDQFEEELPARLFEACAMFSADLFAMEKLGIYPVTCRAIAHYWGDEEGFFKLPEM